MKRQSFTQRRFILCEGFEDSALARALIVSPSRKLQKFDVSPNNDVGPVPGNTGFEEAVIGSETLHGFENVDHVVIVADNDDNPNDSFNSISEQIKKAKSEANVKRNWAIPARPGIKMVGDPSVTIWMWPSVDEPGCLETALWRIIQRKYQTVSVCVEAAMRCAGADAWPISKLDKARIRCFISIYCRKNPALVLGFAWRDFPELFPVDSKEFDEFSSVLAVS